MLIGYLRSINIHLSFGVVDMIAVDQIKQAETTLL
ncbi:hypothetical protein IMSAGC004_00705 [Bacteroidaceae bacterium]|nr:hypothetical protein IMSAGC004_00705 [Bacteroidaceae bacterium]